jgi:hypothetical protein
MKTKTTATEAEESNQQEKRHRGRRPRLSSGGRKYQVQVVQSDQDDRVRSLGEVAPQIPIADVVVGERFRKDLGDLRTLMDSIKGVGLLQPVVLTPELRLIAGHRRLKACQELGWTHIPAYIINIDDVVRGEHDENALRKALLPSEMVAITEVQRERLGVSAKARSVNT